MVPMDAEEYCWALQVLERSTTAALINGHPEVPWQLFCNEQVSGHESALLWTWTIGLGSLGCLLRILQSPT
jgi:hypothetical protein